MASSTAPDALAAMAVNREAEGAGGLLGPERTSTTTSSPTSCQPRGRLPRSWMTSKGGTRGPPWGGRLSNSALTLSTAVV